VKKKYRDRVKNRPKKEIARTGHAAHVEYTAALPKRADLVARHLEILNVTFENLLSDEHFLTLLRAESMTTIPHYLAKGFALDILARVSAR
jgi:hypothetical protein